MDGYAPQMLSPAVENLVAQLTRLPGIGARTAQRLAFHILQRPKDEALALAAALTEVKERVRFCRECGNNFVALRGNRRSGAIVIRFES